MLSKEMLVAYCFFLALLRGVNRLRKRLDFLVLREIYRSRMLEMHHTVEVVGLDILEKVKIEGRVYVGALSVIVIDDDKFNSEAKGSISFGSDVYVGDQCNIRACGAPIFIGSKVMIANGCTLVSTNHGMSSRSAMIDQPWSTFPSGITIEENVWIGAHAVLLPGTQIRTGSIIAAGAVVTGEVPAMSVFGGVPARMIKRRI